MNVKNILCFTPYDNKYNLRHAGFTEETFYKHFYEPIKEHEDLKNSLLNVVDPTKSSHVEFLLLSGYSGCGKTTFLNWFRKRVMDDKKYHFHMVNILEKSSSYTSENRLVKHAMIYQLKPLLQDSKALALIEANQIFFQDLLVENELNESVRHLQFDSLIKLYKSGYGKIPTPENQRQVNDCLEDLTFKTFLVLFFLEHILRERENGEKDNYIFCFDNLDELKYEYLSSEMWKDFLDAREKLQSFFDHNELNIHFDFLNKVTVILCLRESNVTISNAQLVDRLVPRVSHYRLVISGSVKKILERRLNYILQSTEIDRDKDDSALDMLKCFEHESGFMDDVALPLVNFDYRKLLQLILEITDVNAKKEIFKQVSFERYKKLSQHSKPIAKGLFFNAYIAYSTEKQFYKLLDGTQRGCRISRILLTIIFNLSYPNGLPRDHEQRLRKIPKRFPITDILKRTKGKYDVEVVLGVLKEFYNTNDSSWAHLITMHGLQLKDDSNFNFDEIKILSEKFSSNILSKSELETLNNVQININAAGCIYLRYIITHFEYFSYLVYDKHPSYFEYKPLFQLTEPKLYHRFNNEYKLPFEVAIIEVYNLVSQFQQFNANEFKEFFKEFTPAAFVDDTCIYSFKSEEDKSKSFYLSRVITTHIRYLDDFRKFLHKSDTFKTKHLEARGKIQSLKSLSQLQEFVCNYIHKYIELLDNDILPDPSIKGLKKSLEDWIRRVMKNGREDGNWFLHEFSH